MSNDAVFKGPVITWDRNEVKKIVEHYGYEEACRLIAGTSLQLEYVRHIVKEMEAFNGEGFEYHTGMLGEGTV